MNSDNALQHHLLLRHRSPSSWPNDAGSWTSAVVMVEIRSSLLLWATRCWGSTRPPTSSRATMRLRRGGKSGCGSGRQTCRRAAFWMLCCEAMQKQPRRRCVLSRTGGSSFMRSLKMKNALSCRPLRSFRRAVGAISNSARQRTRVCRSGFKATIGGMLMSTRSSSAPEKPASLTVAIASRVGEWPSTARKTRSSPEYIWSVDRPLAGRSGRLRAFQHLWVYSPSKTGVGRLAFSSGARHRWQLGGAGPPCQFTRLRRSLPRGSPRCPRRRRW